MKILRYLHDGDISLGVKSENEVIELSTSGSNIPHDTLKLISNWPKYKEVVSE